ncbi:MAG TPA: hypothetical protein VK358_02505 [Longimicrobium sp.]|nr:hypothetical protein [Longimicrobium sp.]
MTKINLRSEYELAFSKNPAEALKHALDIRKFEIDLYWKRASYFWTLITVAFGGFIVLDREKPDDIGTAALLVSSVGFLLSFAWYLVNRGSKYWQENWERHVDCLEDLVVGPLYKTVISDQRFRLTDPLDGYPFSVSKINQAVSLFFTVLWGLLILRSFLDLGYQPRHLGFGFLILLVTVVFTRILWVDTQSRPSGSNRAVDFITSELVAAWAPVTSPEKSECENRPS